MADGDRFETKAPFLGSVFLDGSDRNADWLKPPVEGDVRVVGIRDDTYRDLDRRRRARRCAGRVLDGDGRLSSPTGLSGIATSFVGPEIGPETERRILRRFEEARFHDRITMRYPDDAEVTKPEQPPPFAPGLEVIGWVPEQVVPFLSGNTHPLPQPLAEIDDVGQQFVGEGFWMRSA